MFDESPKDGSTEATECSDEDDPDLNSDLAEDDFDIDDQVLLYGGYVHPPEYYRQGILNPTQRDPYERYAELTRLRLREVEAMWKQYVARPRHSSHHSNNCQSIDSAIVPN